VLKKHSGQFSSRSKEQGTHPEELEVIFLPNSLPKLLSDLLRSDNYSTGSHKLMWPLPNRLLRAC
jgi:hypothetical protein